MTSNEIKVGLKKKHKYLAGIIFIIAIFVLMIIPIGNKGINDTFIIGFRADYIIHCVVYFPWLWIGKMMFGKKLKSLIWLLIGIIIVITLEYIQMLLPYRGFNVNDIIAGLIGIMISYAFFKLTQIIKWKS